MLLLTGCAPPAGSDFWGNPIPDSTCPAPVYEPPLPTAAPDALSIWGRPIGTPEGWGWMVFYFEVLGLATNGEFMDNRFCLPVDIHIFGKAGEADLLMLDPAGAPVQPEGFMTTTPWFGRFAIQYNPMEPRFAGRPPNYEIHLDAAYAAGRDVAVTQNPTFPLNSKASGLGCRIATDLSHGWDSPDTQLVAQDIGLFPVKSVASCVFYGDQFNYHG